MADTALDFLLENMIRLINCNNEVILKVFEDKLVEKDQIEWLYSEFQFLRMFLYESEESRNEQEKVNDLVTRIRGVTSEAEDIIDLIIFDAVEQKERNMEERIKDVSSDGDDIIDSSIVDAVMPETLKDVTFNAEDAAMLNFSPKQLSLSSWLRKFVHVFSGTTKKIMEGVNSFMCKNSCLAGGSTKKMKNLIGESDSEKIEIVAVETDESDGVSASEKMNVAEETDESDRVCASEKMKNFIKEIKTHLGLDSVVEEIKSIKIEVLQICDIQVPQMINKSSHGASSRASNPILEGDIIVGFDDDAATIIELLTEEHVKQLKSIPIIGMAGLGKTTLAKKVYNDPFIEYHFYIRAWTYVSQVCHERDLLLSILSSANIQLIGINQMNDEKLGEELYKRLKGNKYLIVFDDIWSIGAWLNLKRYFPNDNNGSRIMFTSRIVDVAVSLNAKPHFLRFLNEDESWELLEQKAFRKESCPPELLEIGKMIARKCQGLPLAIVVVSGILANKKAQYWWRQVAEGVSSYIVSDPKQYMNTLALSYNHLPYHLRPCFLYFGAFPEDYEIPVWQLMGLWVAEGFIRQNDQKSLEEVAEDYLMDLIDRSLVIASKKRSNGKLKACRVHDLLRDLCLRKAQEVNFFRQILRYHEQTCSSSSSIPFACKQRGMGIHDNIADYISLEGFELHIRSFLSFGHSVYRLAEDVSFGCQAFKLLRVLNLSSTDVFIFPKEIEQLVHLRYLAVHVCDMHVQLSMSNLWNLETLMVDGPKGSLVLYDTRRMVKLRHVYTRRLIVIDDVPPYGSSFVLDNLQTIGKLDLLSCKCGLGLFPNLKKLKCQDYGFPKLSFLIHLETLKLFHCDVGWPSADEFERIRTLDMYVFPLNLKSLTLSNFRLPWEKMSFLGRLPNLEILKLSYKAFHGPTWDTNDGEFRKLRFLKFQGLYIKHWNTSSDHFVNLQTLVLNDCQLLEEIPSSLGDIPTLEMIQVRWCNRSAEDSARQIQEQQKMMGNDGLKIFIYSTAAVVT